MNASDPYLLGYRQAEQERLERQALELAAESNWLFDQIGIREDSRVVEIGEPLTLSDAQGLSDYAYRLGAEPIDVWDEQLWSAGLDYGGLVAIGSAQSQLS